MDFKTILGHVTKPSIYMKHLLFGALLCFCTPLLSQSAVDSVAIRQVDSLIQISREFTGKRDFDKALEMNVAAEGVSLLKFGRESVSYGNCCHNRGKINYYKRDFPEATKWYLEAIDVRAKTLGKNDIGYSNSLNSLAYVYIDIGNYNAAEPLLLEVLSARRKVLGEEHPDYSSSLTTLATLYWHMSYYEKAEPLLLESKAIQEKKMRQKQGLYPYTLNTLGTVYWYTGKYEKAEPLFLEANAIFEKTSGRSNINFAASLINMAGLYLEIGNYPKAASLLLEAKDIFEVQLNIRNDPFYLNCLNSLAALYSETGKYEKATLITLETLAIREKEQGKEHPYYAKCLSTLAVLSARSGNLNEAESLSLKAAAILEKTTGKATFEYASNINTLGGIYREMHDFDKAEQCLSEALTIWAKVLGRENADYLDILINLTDLYISNGNYEKAEAGVSEVASGFQLILTNALHHLSEQEMQQYLKKNSFAQDNALHLAQATEGRKSVSICYNNSLFYKGFLLNAVEQIKRLARSDSTTIQKFNTLKGYKRRIASQYSLSIAERDSNLVLDLEEKANGLEKDLARTVAGYGTAMRQVSWQEVQNALKPGEAAIEFVHYSDGPDSIMYSAMLLRPGVEQPQFIPLFEQKQLESLLQANSGKARKADYVNAVYGIKTEKNNLQGQKTLYERLWRPLEKALADSPSADLSKAGTKTIYFSPSGLLYRLNLNAIPINEKENLSDRFHLVELGSTRQLVVSSEKANNSNPGGALLFGGVQYDTNPDSVTFTNIGAEHNLADTRGELSFTYSDSTSRGGSWGYLKWTEKEVDAIDLILKSEGISSTVKEGFAATEEAFKAIGAGQPSPRILHIATHGFFFPDPASPTFKTNALQLGAEPSFKISEHPMIRSGLLLAGANHAWKTGKPLQPGMEDGVLTAYEISQMDLSNTELVVLSACETGLGDIQGNEGVYGLQRAFKIAGAKYLIMSLWQVPDFQTQELMTAFYQKWLSSKMPIPEAFRAAQQTMREKYEHPYFWAGFVLVE